METIISIVMLISSLSIILAVLFQDSKTEGLAAISADTNIGGAGATDTKSMIINRIVVFGGIIFMASAIIMAII